MWIVIPALLWVAGSSLACNQQQKRTGKEIKDEVTFVDLRSDLQKEIYGIPLTGLVTAKQMDDNTIVLVNSVETEMMCKNKECRDGDLGENVEFPQDLSFEALQVSLDEKRIVLIDVRSPEELRDDGTIPGSVNVPLPEIPEAFLMDPTDFKEKYKFDLPGKEDRNLVLTCRSGRRILVAESKMKPLGYKYLRLYRGSFKEWKANGGEIV